jgi:hypothetical protein
LDKAQPTGGNADQACHPWKALNNLLSVVRSKQKSPWACMTAFQAGRIIEEHFENAITLIQFSNSWTT